MTFRLLNWPRDVCLSRLVVTNGPAIVRAGSTEGIASYTQTRSGVGFLWEFELGLPPMQLDKARRVRGWITAMQGGVNATRWQVVTPDMTQPSAYGSSIKSGGFSYQPWSNGMLWDNGGWQSGLPIVSMAAAATKGDMEVTLTDEYWGHVLSVGDRIGFLPDLFGMYEIVQEFGDGRYGLNAPLRFDVSETHYATLQPVIALRMAGVQGGLAAQVPAITEATSLTLVEAPHDQVQSFWTGD